MAWVTAIAEDGTVDVKYVLDKRRERGLDASLLSKIDVTGAAHSGLPSRAARSPAGSRESESVERPAKVSRTTRAPRLAKGSEAPVDAAPAPTVAASAAAADASKPRTLDELKKMYAAGESAPEFVWREPSGDEPASSTKAVLLEVRDEDDSYHDCRLTATRLGSGNLLWQVSAPNAICDKRWVAASRLRSRSVIVEDIGSLEVGQRVSAWCDDGARAGATWREGEVVFVNSRRALARVCFDGETTASGRALTDGEICVRPRGDATLSDAVLRASLASDNVDPTEDAASPPSPPTPSRVAPSDLALGARVQVLFRGKRYGAKVCDYAWAVSEAVDNDDERLALHVHVKYAGGTQESIDLTDPEDVVRLSLLTAIE